MGPIVAMKGGTDIQKYVDLLIPAFPATIKVIQGEGPVHLVGSHCVDYYGGKEDEDSDDDDEGDEEMEQDEASESKAEEEGKKDSPAKDEKKTTPGKKESPAKANE